MQHAHFYTCTHEPNMTPSDLYKWGIDFIWKYTALPRMVLTTGENLCIIKLSQCMYISQATACCQYCNVNNNCNVNSVVFFFGWVGVGGWGGHCESGRHAHMVKKNKIQIN